MVNSSWLANLSTRGVYLDFCRDMFISRSTPPASSSDRANSAFFLITSFSVASTAAIVSSEVPWSHCGLPDGSFCTRSRIAYFPISSLFLWSIARLRRAVATAHTTRSTSMRSSSTRIGKPFSLRTVARISMLGCQFSPLDDAAAALTTIEPPPCEPLPPLMPPSEPWCGIGFLS
uniref:Uncharacterized protein n=1 Tax=Anopheles merus TaxID=30066 RepID=A0A182UNF7_ANOME